MNDEIIVITDTTQEEWYKELVSDCKEIISEAVFTSRWVRVEGYHALGERIVNENNLDRKEIYGQKIVQGLAESIGISTRTIWYAIQFYEKYPNLDIIPEVRNLSWNKIITKYLPEPMEQETPDLPSDKYRIIYADPPWKYSDKLIDEYGAAEHHYPGIRVEHQGEIELV